MKFFKILLPLIVLGSAIAAGKYLSETGSEAKKKTFVKKIPVVEVMPLKLDTYQIEVETSGIVKAGTQSSLISEVSGRVLTTSNSFQEGAYIDNGGTLLTIDKENYNIALSIAESEVAGNRAALAQLDAEEKSNKRSLLLSKSNLLLGKKEVIRLRQLFRKKLIARSILDSEEQKVNQLEQQLQDLQGRLDTYSSKRLATKAKLSASQARKRKERLNLSRTVIKAPYTGRILEKNVDVGQFVTAGTTLGKLVTTDYVEVVLPLSLSHYDLLDVPINGNSNNAGTTELPKVSFSSVNIYSDQRDQVQWQGHIVRTSVALDSENRQITVIARIDDPFETNNSSKTPIRIGQYLKAKIKGKKYNNIYIVPPIAVRQNKEILLLDKDKVEVILVDVIWSNPNQTIVKTQKTIEERQLIITPMNQAIAGMKVITVADQRKKNALLIDKRNNEKATVKE